MKKMMVLAVGVALMVGCSTGPVTFKECSVPMVHSGYTVCGSDVSGYSEQIWVFGMGGSLNGQQQHNAYRQAIGHAQGADALVGMSIESSTCSVFPFFIMQKITVTGTPVKFNK